MKSGTSASAGIVRNIWTSGSMRRSPTGNRPDSDRQHGPAGDAEQQADHDAAQGHEQRIGKLAALREVPGRRGDGGRRCEHLRRDAADGRRQLPDAEQQEGAGEDEPARAADAAHAGDRSALLRAAPGPTTTSLERSAVAAMIPALANLV